LSKCFAILPCWCQEYVGIEFARDLTLQTDLFDTTQQNIFRLYLPSLPTFDVIVVNTGVHDLQVCGSAQDFRTGKWPVRGYSPG
jgi:hypothetical protein